ncbi:MAG: carboxypeptidase-like regulatory domain-containing protein [Candidatus Methylacidiphilales bacterium]
MKLPFTLSIILFLFGQIVLAQNTQTVLNKISGTVTDEINLPLTNATVTIYDNNKLYQTQTDSNGDYTFTQIPLGNYKISFIKEYLKGEHDTLIISNNTDLLIRNKILSNLYYVSNCHYYSNKNTSYGNIIPNFVPPSISNINIAPNQNINAIAAYMRGVDSRNGETPSIMGARPENTAYYIDGVRIAGMDQNLTIIGK